MDSVQTSRWRDDRLLLNQFIKQITRTDHDLPQYRADTRERDKAMQNFVRSESLLSGVVSSAVSRDKNRGWTLSGTARQVAYFAKRLHATHNGIGWRQFVSMNASEWYTTNLGYVSEIGFKYKDGPAETMWNLDSTHCRLTPDPEIPLYYYPKNGSAKVPMSRNEYIQGNSMPSFEESMNYAGYSSVERALMFVRIMIGIHQHQLEKLGVVFPKGILHGTGITRQEYEQALEQYAEDKLNVGTDKAPGVMGLFSKNPQAKLNLIALSQLPDNFSLKDFVDILMQSYALAFGFPVGEFWSIASGSFGRTGEMNIQQEQAYAKGEMDFALSFQEQLQTYFLPTSLNFNFESRNDKGYALKAEIDKQRADIINNAYKAVAPVNTVGVDGVITTTYEPIISKDEARSLYAQHGLIPAQWASDADGNEEISDLQETREKVLQNPSMIKIMRANLNDPVVIYRWSDKLSKINYFPSEKLDRYDFPSGSVVILWEEAGKAFKKYY